MKNNYLIDQEEALNNNLVVFQEASVLTELDTDTPKPDRLDELVRWTIKNFAQAWMDYPHAPIIPLVDTAMQPDGSFFEFCRAQGVGVKAHFIDAVATLPYSEKDFDPFIINGLFKISINNSFFLKASLFYKSTNGADSIASFVIVPADIYEAYIEMKKDFRAWLKRRDGVIINVVAGDDYNQDASFSWDDLFFTEKADIKKAIINKIDSFMASREYYLKHNIPWNMSIMIDGAPGSGKTTLLNTIISNYNFEPITLNYFNADDSVLSAFFKSTENKQKCLLFIDDVDEYVDQGLITQEFLFDSIESYRGSGGNIIILTCNKVPDVYKDSLFSFDCAVSLGMPEYNRCIKLLFGDKLSNNHTREIQKICELNELSYGYIYKLYRLFIKEVANKKPHGKKDFYDEAHEMLTKVIKENEKLTKLYSKKIGLLNKQ